MFICGFVAFLFPHALAVILNAVKNPQTMKGRTRINLFIKKILILMHSIV